MKPPHPRRLALLAFILLAAPAYADAPLQTFLEQTLAAARDKNRLPAVAALIQIDGKIAAEAALGVRALGRPNPVTTGDRWHIGSDTKTFTSTLIARLVEQGVMSFDDTLAAAFPGFAKDIDQAYRAMTVTQLLSHTAGLPPLTDDKDLPTFLAVIKSADGVDHRRAGKRARPNRDDGRVRHARRRDARQYRGDRVSRAQTRAALRRAERRCRAI